MNILLFILRFYFAKAKWSSKLVYNVFVGSCGEQNKDIFKKIMIEDLFLCKKKTSFFAICKSHSLLNNSTLLSMLK